jgi:peptide/nickel transport system substrate-binding protein
MGTQRITRRTLLGTAAVAVTAIEAPFVRSAGAAEKVVPAGKMTLAWHTNIAPRWLDPQTHDGGATPDNFLNIVHDALIKNFRDKRYDHLALAERFEFAEDASSVTFWLRPGTKFHNGDPVTADDVKWTYEHYRGAWGKAVHERTERVEIVDQRTVRFRFKGPFLDLPMLLGTSNVCGIGWVVPAKYYEKVGPEGFAQKPVGAGPYRLVSQEAGTKLEFEAFEDYYRPVHVRHFTVLGVPEPATRVAMLERGEADLIYQIPGDLLEHVRRNAKLMIAPVVSGNFWLQFPGFADLKSPFHDRRVREAVSLAINREAINQAECAGFGKIDGNWINDDVEYALEWSPFEFNLAKAKKLMAEAGVPNGFKVDWLTPAPPYYSRGERVISQLQAIGIQAKLQVMERGVYQKKMEGGMKEWPGVNIIFSGARIGASWASWYESNFKCGGHLAADKICIKELDAKFERYLASDRPAERKELAHEIQREILENYYFVPVFQHAVSAGIGPRIAAEKWQDVFPTVTTAYAYPWEDIKLKS